MDIHFLHSLYLNHPTISTDTRNILPGSLYFALKGANFNGNLFAEQAIKKGAAYAVVDQKEFVLNQQYLLVEDTLIALQNLAAFHRKTVRIPVIAVTGTNGKTTTKELLQAVLSSKFKTISTTGNLNNHIGVPLTLLNITKETEIAVIEMGANHPLEIKALCEIASPTHGLITNIGKAHLEGFGGFEGVIKTKKELYDYLEENGQTIFFNEDNPLLKSLTKSLKCPKIIYGSNFGTYCYGSVLQADPFLQMHIIDLTKDNSNPIPLHSNLIGTYNHENILSGCCIGMHFGISLEKCIQSIDNYIPVNNRSQFKVSNKNKLLLDCYNANPSSLELALKNFENMQSSKKSIIIGDMLELGEESPSEHMRILELALNINNSDVLVVGEQFVHAAKNQKCLTFQTVLDLREWLITHPIEGNLILIKGSRGIQLEKVLDLL